MGWLELLMRSWVGVSIDTLIAGGYNLELPDYGLPPFVSSFLLIAVLSIGISFSKSGSRACSVAEMYLVVCVLHKLVPWVYQLFNRAEDCNASSIGKFRPRLFFCRTDHYRFTPSKHRFKYPMLYVGFPATFKRNIGILFRVNAAETEKRNDLTLSWASGSLFSVDPVDYVNPSLPFDEKLKPLLRANGIDPTACPNVYVVITPRFLNYSFNPVSYFYLYGTDGKLMHIVFEAKNTFGEAHNYVQSIGNPSNPRPRKGYTHAGKVSKELHISPFNNRSGSYQIQTLDPLRDGHTPKVDTHMLVLGEDDRKIMTARVFSVSPFFDLLKGNWLHGMYLSLLWGYQNFLLIPRTFIQAYRLWMKNIPIHDRPEPLAKTRKRQATRHEAEMQDLWLQYIRHRLTIVTAPLVVRITMPEPDPIIAPEVLVLSSQSANSEDSALVRHLNVQVVNPRFFRRFFSHENAGQTLYLDYTTQAYKFRNAHVDDLSLFLDLLSTKSANSLRVPTSPFWLLTTKLRSRKVKNEMKETTLTTKYGPLQNNMDGYFLSEPMYKKRYEKLVLRAVLADLILPGLGECETLDLYEAIWKLVLRWSFIAMVIYVIAQFFSRRSAGMAYFPQWMQYPYQEAGPAALTVNTTPQNL